MGLNQRVRARLLLGCALLLLAGSLVSLQRSGGPTSSASPSLTKVAGTPTPTVSAHSQAAPLLDPAASPGSTAATAAAVAASSAPAAPPAIKAIAPAPIVRTTPNSTVTYAPVPVHSSTPTPKPTASATPTPKPGGGHFSKVVVILMENEEYSSIIGNSSAPYINALAVGGALATQYYAVSHPSLPNYLALTGGSTFGVTNDCNPSPSCAGGTSVVQEMTPAGVSWKAYMDDMPSPCATADSGQYAVRHNPFVYYANVVATSCGNIVAGTQLRSDIAAGALPQFSWLTPNLCNDMHDCSVATGDAYLAGIVPQLLGAVGPTGAVFVVWDEGTSNVNVGGQVTMVAAGPGVKKGYNSPVPYDHYSLLRTIEDNWGLPRLGNSAGATAMSDLFP